MQNYTIIFVYILQNQSTVIQQIKYIKIEIFILCQTYQSQSQAFSYKLPQSSINQSSSSCATAINKNKNCFLVETEYFINCFAFNRGEIKLISLFHFGNCICNTLNFQIQKQILFQVQIHSFVNIHQSQWLIQYIFEMFLIISYNVLNFTCFE
ncbi:unnamed protein product [Paramecium primaurelia]|uniref:Uncharacterized protein n=1 Tax=Paramecium primaurelia TaxID=5886 RepID=A0A8S1QWU4_PARPR|nr:unnamed protein product [Paramecium primaurelia]